MTKRFVGKERKASTVVRDNWVHDIYEEIMDGLGDVRHVVSRGYIYEKISKRTGLCTKTIGFILNHTLGRKEK